MKMQILAMRDVKVGMYMQPFAALNVPSASRDLTDALTTDQKHLPWQKHPEDFELYQTGVFDDETGLTTGLAQPQFLFVLANLLAKAS